MAVNARILKFRFMLQKVYICGRFAISFKSSTNAGLLIETRLNLQGLSISKKKKKVKDSSNDVEKRDEVEVE